MQLFAKSVPPHNAVQSVAELLQFVNTFAHLFPFPETQSAICGMLGCGQLLGVANDEMPLAFGYCSKLTTWGVLHSGLLPILGYRHVHSPPSKLCMYKEYT